MAVPVNSQARAPPSAGRPAWGGCGQAGRLVRARSRLSRSGRSRRRAAGTPFPQPSVPGSPAVPRGGAATTQRLQARPAPAPHRAAARLRSAAGRLPAEWAQPLPAPPADPPRLSSARPRRGRAGARGAPSRWRRRAASVRGVGGRRASTRYVRGAGGARRGLPPPPVGLPGGRGWPPARWG